MTTGGAVVHKRSLNMTMMAASSLFYFFGLEENRWGSVLCFKAVVSWPDALVVNNSFRTLAIYILLSQESQGPFWPIGYLSNIDANLCFQVTQILKIYKSNDFIKIQRETAETSMLRQSVGTEGTSVFIWCRFLELWLNIWASI